MRKEGGIKSVMGILLLLMVESLPASPPAPLPEQNPIQPLYVDSAATPYDLWDPSHRLIAYDSQVDTVAFCARTLDPSGSGSSRLSLSWASSVSTMWTTIWGIDLGLPGDSTPQTQVPRASQAFLLSTGAGCAWLDAGQPALGTEDSSVFTGRFLPYTSSASFFTIPFKNLVFGVFSSFTQDTLYIMVYDPATGTLTQWFPSVSLSGTFEPHGLVAGPSGIPVVFGINTSTQAFSYAWYDTLGGDFISPIDVLPDTFSHGWAWMDAAAPHSLDQILFVVDAWTQTNPDLPDAVYGISWDGSTATVFRLDDPATPKRVHMPQIAASHTGAGTVVIWAQADPATADLSRGSPTDGMPGYLWDIYANYTTDTAFQTWVVPINLTQTPGVSEWMPHLAREPYSYLIHIGVYLVYGKDATGQQLDGYVRTLAPNGAPVRTEYDVIYVPVVFDQVQYPGRDHPTQDFRFQVIYRSSGTPSLLYTARQDGRLHLSLFDALGRQIWEKRVRVSTGTHRLPLPVNGRSAGRYTLRIRLPDGSVTHLKVWHTP